MKFAVPSTCGSLFYQYFAAVSGSMGIISSEMHFGWPSPSLPVLTNGSYHIHATGEEASWIAVAIFPGIAVGAILAYLLANTFGRKTLILLSSLPLFTGWIAIALARSKAVLFTARLCAGIGSGISFTMVPMYLGEISETQVRGSISSICPLSVVVGILLINVLGIYFPIDTAAYLSCVLPLVMSLLFVWMPESPEFLMLQRRYDEARRSFAFFRHQPVEFQTCCESFDGRERNANTIGALRRATTKKALVIAVALRGIQQLSGSTAIIFYCKSIFLEMDEILSADAATILYFCLQFVFSLISSLIVDVVGRRSLFLVSLCGTAVTLLAFGTILYVRSSGYVGNYALVTLLLANVIFFNIGVRNIPLLVISEIFTPDVKPLALCFLTLYYGSLAVIVAKSFHLITTYVAGYIPFLIFGMFSTAGFVLAYCFLPETSGKSFDDIQKILSNEKSAEQGKC
ncbi:facilitated trehalose transporter Tret1-like [Cylas formicarius]|uniref:facilitated trehalose transporter Tret1-like n=1 Tax=Cylas formicarius TaxID=197179 RepID=UPI0029589B5F|nr:facilitated trehalose transporter Tret1-like [Cylas formicarius]